MISIAENKDCMIAMKEFPDKFFDLAVVDPPYGIGFDGEVDAMANNSSSKWMQAIGAGYERKGWDTPPSPEYFKELKRVSKNQIVWGGNYFELPQSSGWIFWEKGTADGFTLSPGELAWTSYRNSVKRVAILWAGFRKCEQGQRIHPTQKPIKLYQWIFHHYAKAGDKILDTHLGSGSSRIAAHKAGLDFWGFELDADYFEAQEKRFKNYQSQMTLQF